MARPLKKRALHWLALNLGIPVGYVFTKIMAATVRLDQSTSLEELYQDIETGSRYIFAIWHCDLLTFQMKGQALNGKKMNEFGRTLVMVSQSRDGDLGSRLLEIDQVTVIRGSSTRGGGSALRKMVQEIKPRDFAAFAVDGPRGPRGKVKPGIVRMAQLTGMPIMPVVVHTTNKWVLGSWDQMEVPKPFSTTRIECGKLMYVDAESDSGQSDTMLSDLQNQLSEMKWGDNYNASCKTNSKPE